MKSYLAIGALFLLLFSCAKDPVEEIVEEVELQNSEGISSFELEVVNFINTLRANGAVCGSDQFLSAEPVYWNDVLDQASEMHAADMKENNFISHFGSNGSSPTDRLDEVNYAYAYSGENVAKGPQTIDVMMEEFMNSPTHCAVIMSPQYTHVGIAKIDKYWVLNFAKPKR